MLRATFAGAIALILAAFGPGAHADALAQATATPTAAPRTAAPRTAADAPEGRRPVPAKPAASERQAPARDANGVTEIRYDVTWDRETAERQEIHVEMSFRVDDAEPVVLSLPAWTPGSYELDDFAQNVRSVEARQDGAGIFWDKADHDSWRVHPTGPGRVTLAFDYLADALDVGSTWSAPDFAFFNGTTLLPFPEGSGLEFGSEVRIHTEADWAVATGLRPDESASMSGATATGAPAGDGPGPGGTGSMSRAATAASGDGAGGDRGARRSWAYEADGYHELVDMPTFVGAFDVDSLRIDGRWYRLATYPEGALEGEPRELLWDQIEAMMPPMAAVTGEVPWEHYTTLLVFDPGLAGGSALEHANSHLGAYHPQFIGTPILASITAHEIFHAWNVKRLRPADLWPYDYGRRMPTELLWISEGITDYYADLALVRGGIVPREVFYRMTGQKIGEVADLPPVALEDASLSTWVGPRDGTSYVYYPKGSLAGLLLDILIRDASDNERSLDDVIDALYDEAYLQGRGFTEEEWWAAVREASGGRSFQGFHDAYVDGREAYPWDEVLPLAGLELRVESERVARIGVSTSFDDAVRVVAVEPGSTAARAGVREGDELIRVGTIAVDGPDFGARFRERFEGRSEGTPYEIVVERDGERLTLEAELRFVEVTSSELREDGSADRKARRIREGILRGSTGR